jgi:lipopolysaccharide transport system ATP-binding protein
MDNQENLEVLVSCKGVSKKFCRNLKRSLWYGVKDSVSEIVRGESSDSLRKDEFWALDDVSFELKRGECLGLLGRNGAGKTTLLKVLSGLIKPDKGTVTLKGNIGGLIALGAGFNGILSGRENIRINGAILGYARPEIEDKMDEIVEFAELHEFIDAPVQTYSSGMNVRLGFAIAAILTKPDVLLLDEVLAVGDIGFTIKCLNAVRKMMKNSAVIFVSHNMQFISQFCTKTILFHKGVIQSKDESVSEGINAYLSTFSTETTNVTSQSYSLNNFRLTDDNENTLKGHEDGLLRVPYGKKFKLSFEIEARQQKSDFRLFLYIMDMQSTPVVYFKDESMHSMPNGCGEFTFDVGVIDLNSGKYSFTVGLMDTVTREAVVRLEGISPFLVIGNSYDWGSIIRPTTAQLQLR